MAKHKVAIILILLGLIVFLTAVFSSRLLLPQNFSIGPIRVYYYGVIIALAATAAYFLAKKRAKQYQITEKASEDIIFWVILAGFVGARLYHVLSSVDYYWHNPAHILMLWHGGLSIYGALVGGAAAVFFLAKTYKLKPLSLLDWLTPSLIVGQIIGRFGNLFNYELYGYPTNLPWKMFVPQAFRLPTYQHSSFFHPLFLYEALANFLILVYLLKFKKISPAGSLFFSYVLWYNAARFVLEFLRIDSVFIGQIRQNAFVSLILVCVSAFWLIKQGKHAKIS